MELTFEQIQEAITNDTELAKKITGSLFTPEAVSGYLETTEGKQLIQPKMDSYFSKGLDTWKNNNLQKLINDEVARRNPAETPEQKAIRELNSKMAQIEGEKVRAEQIAIGQAIASEKGLPTSLVPYFIGDNESDTRTKLNFLELEYKSMLEKQVEARLKTTNTSPTITIDNNSNNGGQNDFMSMSYEDRVALFNQNPQLFRQMTGR